MSDKMTVKDLATELNLEPKELLQSIQQLGITAKSSTSSITGEDIERVKAHAQGKSRGNVIVRRRQSDENPAASTAKIADEPKKAEKKSSTTTKVAKDTEAKKTKTETKEETVAPVKKAAKPAAEKTKTQAPKQTPNARVVSPAKTEVVADETPKDTPKAETTAKDEPKASADTAQEKPAKAKDKSKEDSKDKAKKAAAPDASAMPDGSSTPQFSTRTEDAPENAGEVKENGADDDSANKKKRGGKKKPTPQVEVQQVRVISRPTPEAMEQQRIAEAKRNASPAPRGDGRSDNRGDRGGRPPRPAGTGHAGHAAGQGAGPNRFNRQGGAPSVDINAIAPDSGEGQSKKKRMKGRRTVDFQQGGFGRFGQDDENAARMGRTGKGRRKGKDSRQAQVNTTTQPLKAAKRKIRVAEAIRVADMAHQMGLKSHEIIKVLFNLGVMATINQSLDIDTATLVAAEFEYEVEKAGFSEDDYLIPTEVDKQEDLRSRPPVVTIMGHVDHGKTSLLDAIRKSNVTTGEAGGITQHIGAYHVRTKRGEIVFLDTPGHEAFTAMRARGAQVTDLVILVVAADDGVMEQTREAINHSKAANVPIMVAVNKMDKEGADPDRVMRELAELGLQAEDWGGDTVTAKVSAKSRAGLDELLELVALQAEILELQANPNKPARGRIVEAKLDKGRGPVATVLIQEGTLNQGDTFVCGVFSGRVRALFNDQGKKVKEAGPAIPVEVQGFDGVPIAGDEFVCVADEKLARRIADARAIKQRERHLAKESKVTLETFLASHASDKEALTLNLVLKADVQGSLEAITEALNKKSTDKVRINIVHGGAGAISESDILLASASHAIIIGFNVRPTAKIKEIAEQENVDIRFYDIIYKLGDDITNAMQGMLAPVQREQYLGQADVRDTFSVPKIGVIAGCHVADGKMLRSAGVRLLRDGVVVYTGKISSLKRFKDDAREVLKGYECGIGLENYNDIKVGDVIEAFEMIEEAATL